MDATAYYAIGIPLYIVLFGVETLIGRARRLPAPSFAGSISNITAGLGAIVVGMVVGPLMVGLYDWAFHQFALVTWTGSWWIPFVVALVLGDLGNYWRHRAEHRFSVLWAVHNVHHTPAELNLSVGMRHAWLSDTYAFPFYAALPVLGIPTAQFFLAMVALTLYALFTHSRAYDFPSFGVLVTPRTHAVHHACNPRYVGKNFAAMLSIWDRMFGTYAALDPADPPVFGLGRTAPTHDAALAQWLGFAALFTTPPERGAADPLPTRARLYVTAQLALLVAFSAYVYGLHGWPALAGGLLVILAITSIGGLLDRRRSARAFEMVRLAIFVPAAVALVGVTW